MNTGLRALIVEHLRQVYHLDPERWTRRKDMEKRPEFKEYSGHTVTIRSQELAKDKVVSVRRLKVGKVKYAFYRFKPQTTIVWKKRKKSHDGKKEART